MNIASVNQFLILYAWFLHAALLLFFLLIGRFYQRFSGSTTHYRLFGVVILCYGASAVRYASLRQVRGDWLADAFATLGGALLLMLSAFLYRRMMSKTR